MLADLSVAEFEFSTMAFFPADAELRRNVLGRFGWLDRVVLGLVDYEGKLLLLLTTGTHPPAILPNAGSVGTRKSIIETVHRQS